LLADPPPPQGAGKELPPPSKRRRANAATRKKKNFLPKKDGASSGEAVAGDYSGQPQPGVAEPGAPFLAAGDWKPTAAA
jgi:hypothetical protein